MADDNFKINVITTYDGTGVRRAGEDLDKIRRRQAEAEAKWASSPLNPKNAPSTPPGGGDLGFGGLATGFGTMIGFVTSGINRWKAFNDELDRFTEKSIAATAKMYELGQAIIETQDKMISQKRTATEPLADSYVRLSQELVRLKTEQSLLELPSQAEEWNKLQKQIQATESEISGVVSKLGGVPPPPMTPGPKAGKGESQALVDEIERNRKAAEDQLKEDVWEIDPETGGYRRTGQKQFPIFQPPPPPPTAPPDGSKQYPSPIGPPIPNEQLASIESALQQLLTLWR